MKKRITAVALSIVMLGFCLYSGIYATPAEGELFATAAVRDLTTEDGSVYFDDEAIALSGSVYKAGMTDAEKARADELRSLAMNTLSAVNAQRASAGLSALTWNTDLESCASVRSEEIVSTWSHTRPNGSDWYTVNSNVMWGENLAKNYSSTDAVVAAWMASPTHKANIMDGSFATMGIAIYEVNGVLYWAQEFGR
ncbi:MAG: CAP domain-containing protein [Lachnospiraceae bacterium]|nr:CAP domain-containing protein [Lachnospiraceae bacterium]